MDSWPVLSELLLSGTVVDVAHQPKVRYNIPFKLTSENTFLGRFERSMA